MLPEVPVTSNDGSGATTTRVRARGEGGERVQSIVD
jgi:hypothetical protein